VAKEKRGLPFWRYEERIPTDDFEEIIYEKDGPVGRLILNQPERRNPLSYGRICELAMGLTSGSSSSRARARPSAPATT